MLCKRYKIHLNTDRLTKQKQKEVMHFLLVSLFRHGDKRF